MSSQDTEQSHVAIQTAISSSEEDNELQSQAVVPEAVGGRGTGPGIDARGVRWKEVQVRHPLQGRYKRWKLVREDGKIHHDSDDSDDEDKEVRKVPEINFKN